MTIDLLFKKKRRGPDLNWDIPKETGSQGQRITRLCHRAIPNLDCNWFKKVSENEHFFSIEKLNNNNSDLPQSSWHFSYENNLYTLLKVYK